MKFVKRINLLYCLSAVLLLAACGAEQQTSMELTEPVDTEVVSAASGLLNEAMTQAQTPDGLHISWREHRIDDQQLSGVELRGSDEGSANLGHSDRWGGNVSWNDTHVSAGCSQEALISTGGDGLFYCFAAD
jgi:hypothetical protein